MTNLSTRDLVLLVLLTLAWGINWPIMKFGVTDFPPMLFRVLVLGGGVAVLGVWIRLQGGALAIPASSWRQVLLLSIPNVIVWHVLSVYALQLLPSGRAAILGYTMPVWAVVLGVLLYRERPLVRHWWGIGAALAGMLLLLASELRALAGSPLGTALMLAAAASWGWGTLLMRRHLTAVPAATLGFWLLACGIPVVAAATLVFEVPQWRAPTPLQWGSILYNIFVAIAFCHIVWFMLARALPPAASGLSVMMIPVLGVFSGMAVLGERPHWQDYAALVLILAALGTVLLDGPARSARAQRTAAVRRD
jgi:drug/metabolite transporter (DMT)-like permease